MKMSSSLIVDLCNGDDDIREDIGNVFDACLTKKLTNQTTFVNGLSQPGFINEHGRRQNFDEFTTDMGLMDISSFHVNNEFVNNPSHVRSNFQVNNDFVNNASYSNPPIVRQFWKAGDYDANLNHNAFTQNGCNRLRVHPKFLHSNATSHKWAFGAVAELLDNAVDEVQNGATFVIVDKITTMKNGSPALLIQDDGGGMDPISLRRCMSFGFSDKQPDNSIGHYGNGFKTSTMRLGADVIVFSKHCSDKRNITQSVGLLSYTFLIQTNCYDVIVPMVDYHIDPLTGEQMPLIRHGQSQFHSNLSTLLKWSPFSTEADLLAHFNDMGDHGTKVIVFNLWFNDGGDAELDFDADLKDIMISGAPKVEKTKSTRKLFDQNHIGTRYRYSLRVYLSILYLHLPPTFRIILRGQVVEPHHIVEDLIFCECIKYCPQGGDKEEPVITTIGFLEGSPVISITGFNIYHKNRLILPFWSAFNRGNAKCKGIAGVLEVNNLKPTHNKQDFERSNLFVKLETRLRDMAVEYWDHHCHLVGYPPARKAFSSDVQIQQKDQQSNKANKPVEKEPNAQLHSVSGRDKFHIEITKKRKLADKAGNLDTMKSPEMSPLASKLVVELGSNQFNSAGVERSVKGSEIRRQRLIAAENMKLRTQCVELEKAEKQHLLKVKQLRDELQLIHKCTADLAAELKLLDGLKVEK